MIKKNKIDSRKINQQNIDWVIVGGESRNMVTPMDTSLVFNIKEQCNTNNIAFFFKQWDTWGADKIKQNKKENGKSINDKIWLHYPEKIKSDQLILY